MHIFIDVENISTNWEWRTQNSVYLYIYDVIFRVSAYRPNCRQSLSHSSNNPAIYTVVIRFYYVENVSPILVVFSVFTVTVLRRSIHSSLLLHLCCRWTTAAEVRISQQLLYYFLDRILICRKFHIYYRIGTLK